MKYVQKPVEVEAFRFNGTLTDNLPKWAVDACKKGAIAQVHADRVSVRTAECWFTAKVGDYIIRGVDGELYPCRADVFEETHLCIPGSMLGYCIHIEREGE